jgi:hypothetical protein
MTSKDYKEEVIAQFLAPVKTGVQRDYNALEFLDSGFRRNDLRGIYTSFAITSEGLIFIFDIVILVASQIIMILQLVILKYGTFYKFF